GVVAGEGETDSAGAARRNQVGAGPGSFQYGSEAVTIKRAARESGIDEVIAKPGDAGIGDRQSGELLAMGGQGLGVSGEPDDQGAGGGPVDAAGADRPRRVAGRRIGGDEFAAG